MQRTELSPLDIRALEGMGFKLTSDSGDHLIRHERMFALLFGDFDAIRYELYPGLIILVGSDTDWELPLDPHLATNLHLLMAALMTHNTELAARICDQARRLNEAPNV